MASQSELELLDSPELPLKQRDKYSQKGGVNLDAREDIKKGLLLLRELAAETDSETIKQDIDLLIGVTLQLVTELTNRNAALAKQCQPRKAKPPKASPASGPKKPKLQPSSTDTPSSPNDAEVRSQGRSRIMQGVHQAEPSLADQQRALRQQTYDPQNDDVAFAKAARAMSR